MKCDLFLFFSFFLRRELYKYQSHKVSFCQACEPCDMAVINRNMSLANCEIYRDVGIASTFQKHSIIDHARDLAPMLWYTFTNKKKASPKKIGGQSRILASDRWVKMARNHLTTRFWCTRMRQHSGFITKFQGLYILKYAQKVLIRLCTSEKISGRRTTAIKLIQLHKAMWLFSNDSKEVTIEVCYQNTNWVPFLELRLIGRSDRWGKARTDFAAQQLGSWSHRSELHEEFLKTA